MKGLLILCIIVIGINGKIFAQTDESTTVTDTVIYAVVDKMPEFPGGLAILQTYLAQNIIYPQDAIKNNITGTVVVKFVVEKDGSISNPVLLKDIGFGCGEHVISIVKKMPVWSAGILKEQKVRVNMVMPVSFRLPKIEEEKK